MGRKFEGPAAFIPTPKVVTFQDFDVGQTYTQMVTLTNVSLGRDTFKVGLGTQLDILPEAACIILNCSSDWGPACSESHHPAACTGRKYQHPGTNNSCL